MSKNTNTDADKYGVNWDVAVDFVDDDDGDSNLSLLPLIVVGFKSSSFVSVSDVDSDANNTPDDGDFRKDLGEN